MAFLQAKNWLKKFNLEENIIQFSESTATVHEAAGAVKM